jgi:hypothetical protein
LTTNLPPPKRLKILSPHRIQVISHARFPRPVNRQFVIHLGKNNHGHPGLI